MPKSLVYKKTDSFMHQPVREKREKTKHTPGNAEFYTPAPCFSAGPIEKKSLYIMQGVSAISFEILCRDAMHCKYRINAILL